MRFAKAMTTSPNRRGAFLQIIRLRRSRILSSVDIRDLHFVILFVIGFRHSPFYSFQPCASRTATIAPRISFHVLPLHHHGVGEHAAVPAEVAKSLVNRPASSRSQ